MRWLSLCTLLRYLLAGLACFLLYQGTEKPGWMPAAQVFAVEWRTTLDRYPDPESAKSHHRELVVHRFSSDEWIVGICRDAPGIRDAGAFVVKDSTGQTRVFFGQGCTSDTLATVMSISRSLDEFYHHENWALFQFKEVTLE